MKFSIIVPIYNSSLYIASTLDNLLKQNVEKQIVLVNDGSTDDSLSIIRRYEKLYPNIVVVDKENGGVSTARNIGIEYSNGDYLIFVDSDDRLNKDTLPTCQKMIETHQLDAVFFSYKFIYCNKNEEKIIRYDKTGLYETKMWITQFERLNSTSILNCIGTTVYSRKIIEDNNLRFNESITYCEDVSFCTNFLRFVDKLYYINEPYYEYMFVNSNSLMTKFKVNFVLSKDYLHRQQLALFEKQFGSDIPYGELYRVWASDILSCIFNLLEHNQVSQSIKLNDLKLLKQLPYLLRCFSASKSYSTKLFIIPLLIFNAERALKCLDFLYNLRKK